MISFPEKKFIPRENTRMKTKLRSKYEIFPHGMFHARPVATRRDAVPFTVSGGGKILSTCASQPNAVVSPFPVIGHGVIGRLKSDKEYKALRLHCLSFAAIRYKIIKRNPATEGKPFYDRRLSRRSRMRCIGLFFLTGMSLESFSARTGILKRPKSPANV